MDSTELKTQKRRRLASVLGLSLDGSRLEGVVLRRSNGSLQVQQTFSVSLSLDPLTADPELVGREIRNQLDSAGIRERNCVVGLPLKWLLTAHVEVPPLPAADVPGFLAIEAERDFPCDVATLQIGWSVCPLSEGKSHALLTGLPRTHVASLEKVLRAAKLKPIRFALGITALQPPTAEREGVLALSLGETQVGLQVTCRGGTVALRALEGALELQGARRVLQPESMIREARITIGQLPPGLRESLRRIRIFGPRDLAQELADELELRLETMGLNIEPVTRYERGELGLELAAEATVSPALSLAAAELAGREPVFDFLPPRVTIVQQWATRYSSGKLRLAGAAAGLVLLGVLGAFGYQQWQLVRLDEQWAAMAPKVRDLEKVQQHIRDYRPWYDENFRALTIMRQVTEAFPEDGVVSAKTVEIRDLNAVTCTGFARDYPALLKTLDKLKGSRGIREVCLRQIRGKSPMQFTFDFRWMEGAANEN